MLHHNHRLLQRQPRPLPWMQSNQHQWRMPLRTTTMMMRKMTTTTITVITLLHHLLFLSREEKRKRTLHLHWTIWTHNTTISAHNIITFTIIQSNSSSTIIIIPTRMHILQSHPEHIDCGSCCYCCFVKPNGPFKIHSFLWCAHVTAKPTLELEHTTTIPFLWWLFLWLPLGKKSGKSEQAIRLSVIMKNNRFSIAIDEILNAIYLY